MGPPRQLLGNVAQDIRIAGPYVMAEFDNSPAVSECLMRSQGGCPPFVYDISVLDAKPHRQVDIRVKHPIVAVALSPAGAVAWADGYDSSGVKEVQGTALPARGRSGLAAVPIVIYNRPIDLKSLRFTGRTLHWTSNGRAYQKMLS